MVPTALINLINERQAALGGLSDQAVCNIAGVHVDTIRRMRTRDQLPSAARLAAIEQALQLEHGELLALTAGELTLPDGVSKGISANHRISARSEGAPSTDLKDIPEIEVRAGMGLGGESALEQFSPNGRDNHARDLATGVWRMPDDYLTTEIRTSPQFARMIAVEGDSMAPTLQSGDRVLVDTRRRVPSPPGVFAIWDGLGVVVKRIELIQGSDPPTVRIISDNAMHAPYERTADEAAIIGRVVWFGRRL